MVNKYLLSPSSIIFIPRGFLSCSWFLLTSFFFLLFLLLLLSSLTFASSSISIKVFVVLTILYSYFLDKIPNKSLYIFNFLISSSSLRKKSISSSSSSSSMSFSLFLFMVAFNAFSLKVLLWN